MRMVEVNVLNTVKGASHLDERRLDHFTSTISAIRARPILDKSEIVGLFNDPIPDFGHKETGKYLDGRM